MSYQSLMYDATMLAKTKNKVCYLYQGSDDKLRLTFLFHKNWLFKAYPGGRKELSIKGVEFQDRAAQLCVETESGGTQVDHQDNERTTESENGK